MRNFVPDFRMIYEYSMTLRELLLSVDAEAYASIPLYKELLKVKPEYGSSRRIEVKLRNGDIAVSNAHVGSLGDIVTYPIDVDSELQISKVQLLDAILKEISAHGFSESEETDFWNDMTNLQKAKIIR